MASNELNIHKLVDDLEKGAKALDKMLMFTALKDLPQSESFVRIVTDQVKISKQIAGLLGVKIED